MTDNSQEPEAFGVGRLFWITSEAIVAADLTTERIVLWNPGAERLFGYSPEEALGMPLESLVADDLRAAHIAGVRQYRETRHGALVGGPPVDVRAVTKTGEVKDVALTLTDVSDATSTACVLAVIRDVTERREAQRDLAAANDAIRDFVATASHDLRTPLASVLGYAHLLTDKADEMTSDQKNRALGAVLRSAEHALRLVDDLLTLSQIEARALVTRPASVPVRLAVTRALDSAFATATVRVDERLTATVDPDHLQRMLVNYVTNAARHGAPPLQVVATAHGSSVAIRVCDAGPGVPEELRPRLFTKFGRASSSQQGAGLGLSIVKGLAETNGGTAFYEVHPELGTCFGFTVPHGEAPAIRSN